MKIKIIVLSFMLAFLCELNAQGDAFFRGVPERSVSDSGQDISSMSNGQGFSFNFFGDEDGLGFKDFGFESDAAPLGNGLLLLTAASLIYLRRKDSETQRRKDADTQR